MPSIRSQKQIENDRTTLKELIFSHFSDKEFTVGDIYYFFNDDWNKSKFGFIFNDLRALRQQKFLYHKIRVRKCAGKNGVIKKGVVYSLRNMKYALKCFGCNSTFHSKEGVHRIDGNPYCGECYGDYQADKAYMEYYDYKMEEEARNYREAMKHYEKALKDWQEKYEKVRKEAKENSVPLSRVIFDHMPHKPLTREEKELKNYYLNRYGEW